MRFPHRVAGLAVVVCGVFAICGTAGAQGGLAVPVLTPTPAAQAPAQSAGQAPGQPAGQASSAPVAVSPNYRIGPDDNLTVTVWKEPALSGPYEVRPDGKIAMPLLEDVVAAGLTPMELGDSITGKLKKYVQDPLVTVNVTAVNSKRIYLLGEVGRVGPMALTAGLTPLQAIATAGGLGTFAHSNKIYILRSVNGKEQKIPFNYKKAVRNGDEQGVVLQPGDTIVVP